MDSHRNFELNGKEARLTYKGEKMRVPKNRRFLIMGLTFFLVAFMSACKTPDSTGQGVDLISMKSSAFKDGGTIPAKYTCDGANVSPPLSWGSVPKGTKSLVIACEDILKTRSYKHWGLFDLPPDLRQLPENIPAKDELPNGGRHARNTWGINAYYGPCPKGPGTRSYYFKIYALDIKLNLPAGTSLDGIFMAMEGHILKRGFLIGKYR